MNTAQAFLDARLYWLTWSRDRKATGRTMNRMFASIPRIGEGLRLAIPDGISTNPLMVPRHFGADGGVQAKICDKLRALVSCINSDADLNRLMDEVDNPRDGGSFTDCFIARGAGDTPIVICEFITYANLKYVQLPLLDVKTAERYREWTRRMLAYVIKYQSAQLNNHLTWKALYIASCGLVLSDTVALEIANYLFNTACWMIDHDGSMPLELMREDKSMSYTRMNLEALVWLDRIFGKRCEVTLALQNFEGMLDDPLGWIKRYGLPGQRMPGNTSNWRWLLWSRDNRSTANEMDSYISSYLRV